MQLPYLHITLHTSLHKHLCLNGEAQNKGHGYYFQQFNFTCSTAGGKTTVAQY